MKKKKGLDQVAYLYGLGMYMLGLSIVFFMNLIVNLPWYLNLFYLICFFPTGLYFLSKAKRINRELQKKIKKEKRKLKKK